tara:strand:- start:121 stop:1098 length:978 start_codon:yes stop_codon:yes gene_type:complete
MEKDHNKILLSILNNKNYKIKRVKGDASKRGFYNISTNKNRYILMDSGSEALSFKRYIKFSKIFDQNSIHIPKIIHINKKNKLVLMEDLKHNLIFSKLNKNNIFDIYKKAVENIIKIQGIKRKNIYSYTEKKYYNESILFKDWLLDRFLGIRVNNSDSKKLTSELNFLISQILKYNRSLVHRDYHSKNIFYYKKNIYIIDYQDALMGSNYYDLVSLLKDCYVTLPNKNMKKLFTHFYDCNDINKLSYDESLYQFNLIGVQRHMKAAGIFARLSKRDKKDNYIQYLPRTLKYILSVTKFSKKFKIINNLVDDAIYYINESNNTSSR